MANPEGRGKVKPSRPPPPPPSPKGQTRATPQIQLDGQQLYDIPEETQPKIRAKVRPSRPPPPPPSPKAQARSPPTHQTITTPQIQADGELYENPDETQSQARRYESAQVDGGHAQQRSPRSSLHSQLSLPTQLPLAKGPHQVTGNSQAQIVPAEPLYMDPDEEPQYTDPYEPTSPEKEKTAPKTGPKQLQPEKNPPGPGPQEKEKTGPKQLQPEKNLPGPGPQGGSPALPPRRSHHSLKKLTRQNSVEELKQEPPEEPLYVDIIEEPIYVDPDELNLPVLTRKPKPSRPPPPKSSSLLRHSASESSPVEPYKSQARRYESAQVDGGHAQQRSPRSSLHPQLSLPTQLPLAKGPHQISGNSQEELDMLMEWWNTTKCWENIYESDINSKVQEQNKQTLISEAQRVRLALHLFECLLFHRVKIFNNHITQLYGLGDKLDQTNKKARVAGITGGSVAAATGIVLAPFTAGLSLAATAIGVGVAVHGAKGGSSAITDKLYSAQERKKVQEILQEHQVQRQDVDGCLKFIHTGMERLRRFEPSAQCDVEEEVAKMARVAQILGSRTTSGSGGSGVDPRAANGWSPSSLQALATSMNIYFDGEEQQQVKKGQETKLARKIRELARQMKCGVDELLQTRNRIRTAVEQAERGH
ncbi:proteoglycan 4-like isoform X2 [Engraulis encrasicolus]|uniref:proteoglycan 4-like isoform X2 n=1 Tax=Engraulis encrasicolus TaxID=184585 RepID=UPI002FD6F7C0